MAFKKSLFALVPALPLVLGTYLSLLWKIDALTIVEGVGLPKRDYVPEKCAFLVPIIETLVEETFTKECGDAVGLDSPRYKQDCFNGRLGSQSSSPCPP